MININLREAYQQFVASRETFCSDATVENYSNFVRYFVEFMEARRNTSAEHIPVLDIWMADINEYSIFLKSKIKNEGHPFYIAHATKKISSSTRYSYLREMRTFLNYLYAEGIIREDLGGKFKMPKRSKRVIEPLTVEEVEAIDSHLESNKSTGIRNMCLVHFLLDEGMRTGEVYRLKLSDINFKSGYIVIRNGKGMKNRILPLTAVCKKYAKEYIENYRPDVAHDYFLCKNDGQPMNQATIKCIFDRLKVSVPVPRIYPHLLRYTFGTSFILGGGSLELCRHYMGHSDISTTENYLHIANDYRFCENIYRLDEIFKKSFY